MAQQINGKLIQLLPTQEGDGQRGHWMRGGFVVEYGEEYPRKVAFSLFGEDRVNIIRAIPVGTMITVKFHLESREYNEKWYTDLQAFSVSPMYAQAPQAYQQGAPAPAPAIPHVAPQAQAPQQQMQFPANFQQQPVTAQASVQMPKEEEDLPF